MLKTTTLTTEQISKKVGVHSSTICEINQGKRSYCPKEWKYPLRINNQNKTKLSKEDILTIHEKLKQVDLSIQDIANYFSCSRDTIADINRGKRHKIEGVIYPIRTFTQKEKVLLESLYRLSPERVSRVAIDTQFEMVIVISLR